MELLKPVEAGKEQEWGMEVQKAKGKKHHGDDDGEVTQRPRSARSLCSHRPAKLCGLLG